MTPSTDLETTPGTLNETAEVALREKLQRKADRIHPSNRRDNLPLMINITLGELNTLLATLTAPDDAGLVERVARALAKCAWDRMECSDSPAAMRWYPGGLAQYQTEKWSLYEGDARAAIAALTPSR